MYCNSPEENDLSRRYKNTSPHLRVYQVETFWLVNIFLIILLELLSGSMKCFQSYDLNVSSSVRYTGAENGEIKSDLELKILKSQNLTIFRSHTQWTDFSFDRPHSVLYRDWPPSGVKPLMKEKEIDRDEKRYTPLEFELETKLNSLYVILNTFQISTFWLFWSTQLCKPLKRSLD